MKRALVVLGALLGLACSPAVDDSGLVDVIETRPDAPPIAPFTECVVTTAREPATSAAHVPTCSALEYPRHPPAGGPHYGTWADFGVYAQPVPWPFLVHSLEHGAVVLAYNCPEGCPDVLAALERIRAEREDPACRARRRQPYRGDAGSGARGADRGRRVGAPLPRDVPRRGLAARVRRRALRASARGHVRARRLARPLVRLSARDAARAGARARPPYGR